MQAVDWPDAKACQFPCPTIEAASDVLLVE
jgi:hypothetical protein